MTRTSSLRSDVSTLVRLLRCALLALSWLPVTAHAQERPYPMQLVTFDPLGFATGRVAADVEFCDKRDPGDELWFGCEVTAGLSVSGTAHNRTADSRASRHHADVDGVLRIRPERFSGGWIGFRTGVTYADRYGVRPSLGAETGISWLIKRPFYVGASVGVKKVFFLEDASDLRYNPSLRLAAGFAF